MKWVINDFGSDCPLEKQGIKEEQSDSNTVIEIKEY